MTCDTFILFFRRKRRGVREISLQTGNNLSRAAPSDHATRHVNMSVRNHTAGAHCLRRHAQTASASPKIALVSGSDHTKTAPKGCTAESGQPRRIRRLRVVGVEEQNCPTYDLGIAGRQLDGGETHGSYSDYARVRPSVDARGARRCRSSVTRSSLNSCSHLTRCSSQSNGRVGYEGRL